MAARPERQNEYFILGDGISREVIQADICRYLGNDALVRPGNHNVSLLSCSTSMTVILRDSLLTDEQGSQGFFIRAYRNLTSEMIADLKADSARWETDAVRRTNQGKSRGSYQGYYPNDYHMQDYPVPPQSTNGPNMLSASYAPPAPIHDNRAPAPSGPSPPPATYSTPPSYSAAPSYSTAPSYSAPPPSQPYVDPYVQNPYGPSQSPPLSTAPSYTAPHSHSPFSAGQTPPFPQQQQQQQQQQQLPPFSTSTQPAPAVSADIHPSYKYTTSGFGFENGWSNAPRTYPGVGLDVEPEYSPVTTGMNYPSAPAADPRLPGMDLRYTPESAYAASRPQAANNRRAW